MLLNNNKLSRSWCIVHLQVFPFVFDQTCRIPAEINSVISRKSQLAHSTRIFGKQQVDVFHYIYIYLENLYLYTDRLSNRLMMQDMPTFYVWFVSGWGQQTCCAWVCLSGSWDVLYLHMYILHTCINKHIITQPYSLHLSFDSLVVRCSIHTNALNCYLA